jgi:hypothetical protein
MVNLSNTACIKDKIKAFYTLEYIRDKKKQNLTKIFEDTTLIDLMNNLSAPVIDNNLTILCKSIINDEYAKNLPSSFQVDNFDIESESDMNKIYTLIREVIEKAIFLLSLKNKQNESYHDHFEYKLTKSEENIQDEINKCDDVEDPELDELINNFITKSDEKGTESNVNINTNIIQNFVESLFVYDNKKSISKSFRATLENMVINNILSNMIQSNYSEYIYKFDIDPDKFNTFKNYDNNYSISSKSLKVTDDEFNTE